MVSPAAIRKNPSAPPFPTGFPTDRAGPLWLQSVWLWLALCALAALPIWMCAGVPPLVDLGGHLGRYAIQIDGGRSADLAQWYDFHWALLPNLGVDLLVELLAPHFGLETALRGIVMAIPVIAVGGWLVLTRTVHGRLSPFALFALPLAYSYPFEFGFVNFCLATALAGWALALWIALGQRGAIGWRWLVFVPIACALWLCHLVGWFIFCLFAAADEWVRLRDRGGTRGLALAHLALALSGLMAPWLIVAALVHAPAAHEPSTDWFNVPDKLGQLLMGLRDCWMAWDLPSALLQCALIGWAWRSARFSRHRGLALGVIWLALVYAVIPGTVAGSSRGTHFDRHGADRDCSTPPRRPADGDDARLCRTCLCHRALCRKCRQHGVVRPAIRRRSRRAGSHSRAFIADQSGGRAVPSDVPALAARSAQPSGWLRHCPAPRFFKRSVDPGRRATGQRAQSRRRAV